MLFLHLNAGGSTAVLCTRDLSKAFDKSNRCGLYIKLMDRNIPRCFRDVLMLVFKVLCLCALGLFRFSAVPDIGMLSPIPFAVFVNNVIKKLSKSGYGVRVLRFFYLECLLYVSQYYRYLLIGSRLAGFFFSAKPVAFRIEPRDKN